GYRVVAGADVSGLGAGRDRKLRHHHHYVIYVNDPWGVDALLLPYRQALGRCQADQDWETRLTVETQKIMSTHTRERWTHSQRLVIILCHIYALYDARSSSCHVTGHTCM
ncbi:hypothetical protein EGW08_006820, partial [Elysia chlorotica]